MQSAEPSRTGKRFEQKRARRRRAGRSAWWALWLTLALPAMCQPGPAKLEGTVVNSVTGEAIPHAVVQLVQNRQMTFTGSDGGFEFKDLREGEDVILAHKPGFFLDTSEEQEGVPNLVVIGRTRRAVVKLAPEALLTGHVEDAEHEPLAKAYIWLPRERTEHAGRKYWTASQTRTDEEGNFRIAGLMAGEYIVGVGPEFDIASRPGGEREGDAGFGPFFYPGVEEIEAATPTKLKLGQRAELVLVARAQPVYRISGRVEAGLERMPTRVWVCRAAVPGYYRYGGVNPATGEFQVRYLPAGAYMVQTWSEAGEIRTSAAQTVTVQGDVDDVRLRLRPLLTIPIVASGIPAARNRENEGGMAEGATVFVELYPDEWWGREVSGNTRFRPKLANVAPGRYRVQVRTTGKQQRVESVRYGGRDLLQEKLVIEPGAVAAPLEVGLRDDAGRMEVEVPGAGKPYQVVVVAEWAPMVGRNWQSFGTDKVEFESLAPGDYQVFVFEGANEIPWADRQWMRPYESKASRVTVPANGSVTVRPEVIR